MNRPLLDAAGKPINNSNQGFEDALNLIARVQNLEAVVIMLATSVQKGAFHPDDKREIDIYMEAFYVAQTQRGASHLNQEAGENTAIFI